MTAGAEKKDGVSASAQGEQPLKPESRPILLGAPISEPAVNFAKLEGDEKSTAGAGTGAGADAGGASTSSSQSKSKIQDQVESDLPSETEGRRSDFARQFGEMMDKVQSNIFIAGRHLNDLTGYSAIEKLKQDILAQGM